MSGLGHVGLGFAAKGVIPKTKLIVLLLATEVLDMLWIIFYLAGIRSSWVTHGLVMAAVWTLTTVLLTVLITHSLRTSLIIGLLVFSHWIVDFITHPMGFIIPADIGVPLLFEGSPIVGLGLYNTLGGILLGESILILPGVFIYLSASKRIRKMNRSSEGGLKQSM